MSICFPSFFSSISTWRGWIWTIVNVEIISQDWCSSTNAIGEVLCQFMPRIQLLCHFNWSQRLSHLKADIFPEVISRTLRLSGGRQYLFCFVRWWILSNSIPSLSVTLRSLTISLGQFMKWKDDSLTDWVSDNVTYWALLDNNNRTNYVL